MSIDVISSPPNLAQVLEAIRSLYRNEPNIKKESKELASQWLENLQKSVYAWEIADQLLIRKNDVESCYFAAQTLRTKLQTNFSELPPESYSSLRNSIINHLKEINAKVIQTQLALSLTYLAILDTSWNNPVEEMVASGLNWYVIVEILTLLPEELNQSRNPNLKGVGANRRQHVLKYLTSIGPKIITFLTNTLAEVKVQLNGGDSGDSSETEPKQQLAEKLVAKIYRCLGAWLTIIDANDINYIEPLLTSIFASLQDPNTSDTIHDAAADTICSAALLCEEYEKYQHLTNYLLIQVYQLEGVYQHSVNNEDIDKSVNYSRIFTEMAESVVSPLIIEPSQSAPVSSPVSGQNLVSLLLKCIDHYDYEVAEITFHFWYRFAELLHKRNDSMAQLYGHHVMKLLDGLTVHCQLDTDQENLLTPQSDLQEFRVRVKDLVKKVVVIIGASNYLRHNNIVNNLRSSLAQLTQDQGNWEQDEAYLFMISCLIKDIYEDTALVTDVVNLILFTRQCQFNPATGGQSKPLHPQIFATCCNILGELSDWFETQPTILFNHVLDYLLPLITSQNKPMIESHSKGKSESTVTLSSLAASALQQIIGCCASRHLIGNENIIQLLIRICTQLDSLNENAAHNLLQCCATIISQSTENKTRIDQETLIVKILEPSIENLNRIASGTMDSTKSDPIIYMDRISSIFRSLRLKPRLANVGPAESPLDVKIVELWRLIDAVLKHISSASDSRAVERTCRCLRYVIRCLRPIHLLIPVAECIVTLYSQYPQHSCYLYLASILVDEFGDTKDLSLSDQDREKIDNGLLEMLTHFWRPTFALLTGPQVELRNHPETIDDFFRLCTRYLQKNALRFLSFSMLGQILELTLASIALDHREANNSICKFVTQLIDTGKSSDSLPIVRDQIEQLLANTGLGNDECYGQKLVNAAMNCALVTLPSFYIPDMADILWNLLSWDKNRTFVWLEKTLQAVSIHLHPTSPDAAPQQLQEFYESVKKASNIKLIVSSLRCLSRSYR